jgi:hypothetical protein
VAEAIGRWDLIRIRSRGGLPISEFATADLQQMTLPLAYYVGWGTPTPARGATHVATSAGVGSVARCQGRQPLPVIRTIRLVGPGLFEGHPCTEIVEKPVTEDLTCRQDQLPVGETWQVDGDDQAVQRVSDDLHVSVCSMEDYGLVIGGRRGPPSHRHVEEREQQALRCLSVGGT